MNKPLVYCNVCKQDHRNESAQWCDRSDLEIENEKLKKALEIAKHGHVRYASRERWNHYGSTPTFILYGREAKGYDIADQALREIEEVLNA